VTADEPPFRVAYEITADAAVDAVRLVSASLRRRTAILAGSTVAGGVALSLLGEWTAGPMIVIFGAVTWAMFSARAPERWLIRRRFRTVLGGLYELTLGEAGIHAVSPQVGGDIPWGALTEVREDARTVVFLRDRILATYAPTAAFGSPERRAAAVAYARDRIAAALPVER
jgi:hypothetical protein